MAGPLGRLSPYVAIARIDHWFKNSFMLLGVVLAFFYQPELMGWASAVPLGLALLSTCLVASSNYVLNELLDAPQDRLHPVKRHRPVPSGQVRRDCLCGMDRLAVVGLGWEWSLNRAFFVSARGCG